MAATPKEIVDLAAELRSSAELDRVSFEGAARWILDRFIRIEEHQRLREELRGHRCDGSGDLLVDNDGWEAHYPCPGCPACKPTDDGGQPAPNGDECICGHRRERHGATRDYDSACRSCYCERFYGGRPTDAIYNMTEAELDEAIRRLGDDPCEVMQRGDEAIKRALAQARKPTAAPIGADDKMTLPPTDYAGEVAKRIAAIRAELPRVATDGGRTLESVSTAGERDSNAAPVAVTDATYTPAAPVVHVVQLHEDTVRALVAALSVLWPRDIRQNEGPVETADALLAKLKEPKS